MRTRLLLAVFVSILFGAGTLVRADTEQTGQAEGEDMAQPEKQAMPVEAEPAPKPAAPTKGSTRRLEKADAFIAPPDWEFDGFVAGGQDQEIRSLYYLNDLVYLNVGTVQGFNTGDRVSIYKRGERVRDPQNGKFLGYEVRRAATSQVTDKVDGNNCSVRILQANEAVEVGDLVRRDD
jgi:hypothetical protein